MNAKLIYFFVFALFLALAIFLQKKYCILCNTSTTKPKPYSFSRWQLVWWTFIIFASFISIIIASGKIPTLNESTLILLGIGSLTTVSARLIDISDNTAYTAAVTNAASGVSATVLTAPGSTTSPTVVTVTSPPAPAQLVQDIGTGSFLLDILSDKNGISIHRLQAFIFNLAFGIWFIYQTCKNLEGITVASIQTKIDHIIPIIEPNNLILLGISAGIYTALKSTENK